ncbi:MAG: ANTAR domain-containing protein [Oscillospiraceae bacterium]|jgi:response regulator NasT|nr:ANTAR domain-containing protein [Oscillospiraceae bacterium]
MDSALIVSGTEKSIAQLTEMLLPGSFIRVASASTAGEARRALASADYDLYIINSPLSDESGEELAFSLSERLSGEVILIVRAERFDEVSDKASERGVITASKPINRAAFWGAVRMANASHNRFNMIRRENMKLQQKIEDIKIIDRAKLVLISRLSMTEPEAHKYIEKQAMDMRVTRRAVADGILKTHEY